MEVEALGKKEFEIIKQGLYRAGEIALRFWKTAISAEQKESIYSIVTDADREVEEFIKKLIKDNFSDYDILAEESPAKVGPKFFTIDPIDGTSFFQRGLPDWSISIARVSNGAVDFGATYSPVFKEFFHANLRGGAYLNGERINVSDVSFLKDSIINLGQLVTRTNLSGSIPRLMSDSRSQWMTGSTALALANLAAGRIDGSIQQDQSFWDISAGIVLIREAGGMATSWRNEDKFDLTGKTVNNFLASNGKLHQDLLKYIE